ncbi:MAG: signal peptidase II [Nocardioidaceae bacterium]
MQAARGASLSNSGDPQTAHPSDDPETVPPARIRLFIAVVASVYVIDVLTKVAAVATLTDRAPVTIVPGVLHLDLTRNPGAAFSVATGMTVLLSLVAAGVAFVIVRMARRLRDRAWAVALGLLLGGALGNLTDRLLREPGPLRGHVVDFLQLPHWPVFNVADSCIVAAAVLIVVQSVRGIGIDGRA